MRVARYDFLDAEGQLLSSLYGDHVPDDFDLDAMFVESTNRFELADAVRNLLSLQYQRGGRGEDGWVFRLEEGVVPASLWREARYDAEGRLVDLFINEEGPTGEPDRALLSSEELLPCMRR